MPTIAMTGGTSAENISNFMNFTITLSEAALDPVTVSYRVLRDTAADFDLDNNLASSSLNNNTVTFAPGETSKIVQIEAERDTIDEADESIVLELFNPSANAEFDGGTSVLRAFGIIFDDDGPGSNLALFVSDPVIVEGDNGSKTAEFEIRLSQPPGSAVSLSYQTYDISARAGEDYTPVSGTLNLAADQQVGYVSVPVLGDGEAEAAEQFGLIVTPPPSPSINTDGAVGVATILDTDTSSTPELSIAGDFVVEEINYNMRFVLTLSEPALDAISVSYRTLRETAVDNDLDNSFTGSLNRGVVTFAPGETSKEIKIEAERDTRDEADENIVVELFNPSANVVFSGGAPVLRANGTILDNDGVGSNLALFVSDPVLTEADSGITEAVFEIRLSRPAPSEFTLTYETADISAHAGEDYTTVTGSISFKPGQQVAAVHVPVLGDLTTEQVESFALKVSVPDSPAINTDDAVGVATILDTDTSPLPELSVQSGTVLENINWYMQFVITLSEPSLEPVTVNYRTLRDTALDSDLDNSFRGSANNGTVTFAPGETSKTVLIEAERDDRDEVDENITLELFSPSANAVFAGGAPVARATGIILDNDGVGSNLALFVSDPVLVEGNEGQKSAVFDITLSRPAPSGFTLSYETADISAEAGADYIAASGTIDIAPGQVHAAVTVPVVGDFAGEGAESFQLIVTPPDSPLISTDGAVGRAIILDTDTTDLPEISIQGDVVRENINDYLRYVVELSEPSSDVVEVDWAVVTGDAVASDLDNGLQSGTLVFEPGQTSRSIFIEAERDTLDERDESLFMRLTDPVNATFGQGENSLHAIGFILDNDGVGPNRAVAGAPTEVRETGADQEDFFVKVTLSSPAPTELAFDATLLSVSGTVGLDIQLLDDQVVFAPGATHAAVQVRVFGDSDTGEGPETVQLALTPVTGAPFVGDISNTTITILDGPAPVAPDDTANLFSGTPGDDRVFLFGGDDVFEGQAGNDIVAPGPGDDQINGGLGLDTVDYSSASGAVNVYLQYTGRNVGGGEGRDTLVDIENISGSAFGDRLVGDLGDNVLRGRAGDDVLKGKGGDDIFYGGTGDDRMRGADGEDLFFGEGGSDILLGLAGDDVLWGGGEDDFLYGGLDSDTLNGGSGNDLLRGNRGGDTLNGGAGDDELRGGGNGDVLNGNAGNDFLLGEGGGDVLFGGSGDDILFGGFGLGSPDNQSDVFVFASSADGGGGFDRVRDFENGIDRIDLSAFAFSDFADVSAVASDTGTAMRLNFGGGDVLYIDDFSLAQFDASDVILT